MGVCPGSAGGLPASEARDLLEHGQRDREGTAVIDRGGRRIVL